MSKYRVEQFVCDICGWDAKKKSKAKSLRKALAGHKNSLHGRHGDLREPGGRHADGPEREFEGIGSIETRGRKAKLRGELRRLKFRLHKLPKEIRENAIVELEVINECATTLGISMNPSEEDLETIEMIIEDDLKWTIEDYEEEVKQNQEVKRKEEANKDSVDPLEKLIDMEYRLMRKDYDIERLKMQIEKVRERRRQRREGIEARKVRDDDEERRTRVLPNGQLVKMTDHDFAEWLLRYHAIQTRQEEEDDADKVEFIWKDPKTGESVPIRVSPEAYFRWAQGSDANMFPKSYSKLSNWREYVSVRYPVKKGPN